MVILLKRFRFSARLHPDRYLPLSRCQPRPSRPFGTSFRFDPAAGAFGLQWPVFCLFADAIDHDEGPARNQPALDCCRLSWSLGRRIGTTAGRAFRLSGVCSRLSSRPVELQLPPREWRAALGLGKKEAITHDGRLDSSARPVR